ncbi:restriction endonuclease subunit S [Ferribacterium limneticum]|uniref:restriction endonuclease subunit S n=1 Tax=Ferribacterium limneticum TaxID=76259 RepID=UPI001CF88270|nr:restriction endonuclease subunit S [Ferribacterium limneticum]UCV26862.1 restriction endonuclease subunit S [Ferribacterium limneticum]UCV30779.1 restriction endonuclease subunit S [Ferribacterium limneticum]
MSDQPAGWTQTTLGEIAAWGSGGTPSRSEPSYYGGGIPWIKTGELGPRFVSSTEESISVEGLSKSSAKLFPAGSVAIAMYGATIGKTSILGIPATTNQACAVGIPHAEATTKEYLYHFLCSQKEAFVEAGKGGAQPNISQAVIKDWKVPLAPLPEQKRIADKLDSVLARVDACRDRLDHLPALLKRFRRSILAAATSGRLTEDWRLATGDTEIYPYPKAKLLTVATSRLGKMLDKGKNSGSLTPYLRNVNVRWFDFDLNDIQEMRIEDSERDALLVKTGDLLICEGGEPGRCAIWEGENERYIFQKALHRVRPDPNRLLSQWLAFSLKFAADNNTLEDLFTGTTIKHLTGVALANFEIQLPSLPEQTEIVRRIQLLFAFADRLEARLATARQQVGQLTPALLAKAFRGELVPQDPADEPAAELLKRLAAQRAAAPSAKRDRAKA